MFLLLFIWILLHAYSFFAYWIYSGSGFWIRNSEKTFRQNFFEFIWEWFGVTIFFLIYAWLCFCYCIYESYYRHIHSSLIVEHNHNKYTRPSDVRWITIEDLESDRQYQFWVTAVTSAGEGMSSIVITETPSARDALTLRQWTKKAQLLFIDFANNFYGT